MILIDRTLIPLHHFLFDSLQYNAPRCGLLRNCFTVVGSNGICGTIEHEFAAWCHSLSTSQTNRSTTVTPPPRFLASQQAAASSLICVAYDTMKAAAVASTNGAREQRGNFLRELNELEGALFVPTAVPVAAPPSGHDSEDAATIHLLPDDAVAYDYHEEEETSEAPTLPSSSSLHNPLRDKAQIRRATQRGRLETDLEAEVIQRGNRRVHAINYWNEQDVMRANQLAASLNRKEEGCLLQTSDTVLREHVVGEPSCPSSGSPEPYKGTAGREYDVSNYDVTSYDTKEYDVSEYKSVYES